MPRSRRFDRIHVILSAVALFIALGVVAALAANGSVTYTYDALGRVTTANYDTGVCVSYSYDANGNRTSQTIMMATGSSTGYWGCFNWGQAQWGT
jgi:YD repeat-containing protein